MSKCRPKNTIFSLPRGFFRDPLIVSVYFCSKRAPGELTKTEEITFKIC